jgi:hypothetical protein
MKTRPKKVVSVVAIDDKGRFSLAPCNWEVRFTDPEAVELHLVLKGKVPKGMRKEVAEALIAEAKKHPQGVGALDDFIDSKLTGFVEGNKGPVFKAPPKGRGKRKHTPDPTARNQALVQEMLRLTQLHGLDEAGAKDLMLQAYENNNIDISTKMIERALRDCRKDKYFATHFSPERIREYEGNLKARGWLKRT